MVRGSRRLPVEGKHKMKKRCAWLNTGNDLYTQYHDTEWGVPVHDERKLFEMLILEGAQAGLSWETILKKRENYRKAFFGFDIKKCSRISREYEEQLMLDSGIVRNALKVRSVRINALAFMEIQKEFGSFDSYIWNFTGNHPLNPGYRTLKDVPSKNDISDRISKDLKKRGMKFTGSTIIQAYIQAIGIINSHTTDCFRYSEIMGMER